MDYYEADSFTTELVRDKEPQGVEVQIQAAGEAFACELKAFTTSIPWSGINTFLSKAVGAITASSDSAETVSFSEKTVLHNCSSIHNITMEDRLSHLMSAPALILQLDSTNLDWSAFAQFDKTFSVEENEEEITSLQERHPELSSTMRFLVPDILNQEQAWARYFFLSAQIRLGRCIKPSRIAAKASLGGASDKNPHYERIHLTSSFETVKVSEATRSISQRSDASYDFVSRQHSPVQSIATVSDAGL